MQKNNEPTAWLLEEYNHEGGLIWYSIMLTRLKDLPSKKHNIVLTPLYRDESKAEKHSGIKSFKEATQRLIEANGGL
jgi:quinol monooxygenase YgiN